MVGCLLQNVHYSKQLVFLIWLLIYTLNQYHCQFVMHNTQSDRY